MMPPLIEVLSSRLNLVRGLLFADRLEADTHFRLSQIVSTCLIGGGTEQSKIRLSIVCIAWDKHAKCVTQSVLVQDGTTEK